MPIVSALLEPTLTLGAIGRATERIGLVATGSTTFSEPYNIACQFKALDVMTHGRAGWNAARPATPPPPRTSARPLLTGPSATGAPTKVSGRPSALGQLAGRRLGVSPCPTLIGRGGLR
ncbi:LLM class flavin-dependent oxidoreductase [Knoellia sp. S7-12]|uniref:LLM class flavin-dependent oxidoreductase n=1 Tax=Knoellia sp. S7-12 TaxID=3126698 RepID=UPI003368E648